ncbi:MAG: pyridoxal-phosphate dependent enzyme [Thaumarchaeota archaeon]|nr:pyridoxal-phosphate dependent enzyme [Nitrososphaerota archaeon]
MARYRLDGKFPTDFEGRSMWDFADFLPPVKKENIVSLGEGWTPYVESPNFAMRIGLRHIWCKLEGCNPTGSFKDRAASLGLSLVNEWGKKGVFAASDGNAAAAISAYSARARIKCLILISEDAPTQKLAQIMMYSPTLLRVRGLYESASSLESALAQAQSVLPDWLNLFIWAPFNPLLVEPYKTIAYEIALRKEIPDYIFIPVAGGELLSGLSRGFQELREMGLLNGVPKLVAVQGKGADPTVQAIEKGLDEVVETGPPTTVAGAIRVNFGAEHSIMAVKKSGGFGISVTDEQILNAQKQIARDEGIFCEISSAVALAAISEALDHGKIRADETAAAILTGAGLKDYLSAEADLSRVPLSESVSSLSTTLRKVIAAGRTQIVA